MKTVTDTRPPSHRHSFRKPFPIGPSPGTAAGGRQPSFSDPQGSTNHYWSLATRRRIATALLSGLLLPHVLWADVELQYLGAYRDSAPAYGVAVVGNLAYVGAGNAGFRVIDLANWIHPKLGECDTTGYAGRVAVVGRYAYVAEGDRFVDG